MGIGDLGRIETGGQIKQWGAKALTAGIFPPSRKFIFRVIDVRSLAFARAFSRWPRRQLSTLTSQPFPYFPTNFTGRPGRAAVSFPSRITGTPFTTTSEKPAA